MKDTYKLIKELLKNKRYRSLVILGMYLIFITVVVLSIKNVPTKEITTDIRLENFKLKTNYNYTYSIITSIDSIEESKIIMGARFEDKNQLIFEDKTYLYNDVLIGFPINQIDITKLQYDYIYDYIKLGNKSSNDTYSVSLNDFMKIVNGVTITSDKLITIKVIYDNDIVTNIELDLTEYVNYNQNLYDKYMVVINYTNIGNVVDF